MVHHRLCQKDSLSFMKQEHSATTKCSNTASKTHQSDSAGRGQWATSRLGRCQGRKRLLAEQERASQREAQRTQDFKKARDRRLMFLGEETFNKKS